MLLKDKSQYYKGRKTYLIIKNIFVLIKITFLHVEQDSIGVKSRLNSSIEFELVEVIGMFSIPKILSKSSSRLVPFATLFDKLFSDFSTSESEEKLFRSKVPSSRALALFSHLLSRPLF